ncbi:MAG: glycerol dehydrogenase [Heyndrickxia faecalis]|jgi:glycerol dehydrogenase|uniref:Glycerol dehydrogenase n=1 Tax=Heyndrickxia coagulans TaxID=1398 RepID=A0A150K3E7_HEYCO|nr:MULTISPECIES: glycerol dehydrogenase [Heyndrickxia]KYC60977.1 Glycerol dehydrogenase [Heyndrickxia coagulans]KYC63891.1 Glycerol dehydrogenase [Heyndrickxia coagulans]MBQ4911300.1 glycerol dehydrogenase [Heyndrickxia faecalis]MDL5042098.1 glycerol dehydrogenase [Heyndrickxia coagulans]MDT9756928.1 glycerol dehydrogenase [Heyndrickxia coagulans]
MTKIITSPSKFIQGPDELSRLSAYTERLGKKAFIIADEFVTGLVGKTVEESYAGKETGYQMALFGGECSKPEIERLCDACKSQKADVMVGIGGGKTLDTAKAVGYYNNIPVIVAPTIASTDAPTSALSVIYKENGEFEEYLMLPLNPTFVIMDTKVIASAPARLLVSGMGDALATYFEARATKRANKTTMAGGHVTEAAITLAKLCYDTQILEGLKAKLAAEKHLVTEAVEKIIEANTYLSGIGFESGGLAAAHAIHNGLTVLEETHSMYHGEKVAFGTLAQLILEDAPKAEIEEVVSFCLSVGLPVTLGDLGVKELNEEKLRKVAELSCAEGETIYNMPFEVTPDLVYAAIVTADSVGRYYKEKWA